MAKLRDTTVLGTLSVEGSIKNFERLEIVNGEIISGLYFNKNSTPNIREFFSLNEDNTINSLQSVSLIKVNEDGKEKDILKLYKKVGSSSNIVTYYITAISDGLEIPVYYTREYEGKLPGWQDFSNPIPINKIPSFIETSVDNWNGVWVGNFSERNYPIIETVETFNSKLPESSYQFVKKTQTDLPEKIHNIAEETLSFIENNDAHETEKEERIESLKTSLEEIESNKHVYMTKEDFLKKISVL